MAETVVKSNNWIGPAILVGGGILAFKYVVSPLLETLGLKQTQDEKETDKAEKDQEIKRVWNPATFEEPKKGYTRILTTVARSKYLAQQIHDAWNKMGPPFFIPDDDEEQVYSALRGCKNKLQVSQVCLRYAELYKKDLLQDLKARLSSDEFDVCINIVNNLPSGYVKTK